MPVLTPGSGETMTGDSVEISIKGKWARVPALFVNGKTIIVKGSWIRRAIVEGEEWSETEVEDPAVRELERLGLFGVLARLVAVGVQLPTSPERLGQESSAQLVGRVFRLEERVRLPEIDELLPRGDAPLHSA